MTERLHKRKTLLLFVVIMVSASFIVSAWVGCKPNKRPELETVSIGRRTKTHAWCIDYGFYPPGELAYVAFAGSSYSDLSPTVKCLVHSGTKVWLRKPDGGRISLPCDIQLFECIDGKYCESSERVTASEFEAFMNSKPKKYSIEALLSFVRNRKRKGTHLNAIRLSVGSFAA